MTSLVFTMELRGEMVAVNCEVYRSRGQWCFENECVIGKDWELTAKELANLQQAALSIREWKDENEEGP